MKEERYKIYLELWDRAFNKNLALNLKKDEAMRKASIFAVKNTWKAFHNKEI